MNIGILGEGQLAVMLKNSFQKLHPREPAPTLIPLTLQSSHDHLKNFSALIFESEFSDLKALAGKNTFPSPQSMEIFQDKLNQKQLFGKAQVPQPEFVEIHNIETLSKLEERDWVLKWARGGYDGKGVWLKSLLDPGSIPFVEKAFEKGARVYAERRISFDRELALVGCRDGKGALHFFPLVESKNFEGVCDVIKGPLQDSPEKFQPESEDIAKKILNCLPDFKGTFAIEFFESHGHLLVNEMAPRVHNSGHITMDAFEESQFDWHWKSFFNEDIRLTPKADFKFYGMLNLLPLHPKGWVASEPQNFPNHFGVLHWYHKTEPRHLRKMGHINFGAPTQEEFQLKYNAIKNWREQWQKSL